MSKNKQNKKQARKTTASHHAHIIMPESLWKTAKAYAAKGGASVTDVVIAALSRHVKEKRA